MASQMTGRGITLEMFRTGAERFIIGLGKKVLIANQIGPVVDQVFSLPLSRLSYPAAWLGIICYTFQIYFDFSGYSDMAIGLGKMFGFNTAYIEWYFSQVELFQFGWTGFKGVNNSIDVSGQFLVGSNTMVPSPRTGFKLSSTLF
jgi:hypothetical protein